MPRLMVGTLSVVEQVQARSVVILGFRGGGLLAVDGICDGYCDQIAGYQATSSRVLVVGNIIKTSLTFTFSYRLPGLDLVCLMFGLFAFVCTVPLEINKACKQLSGSVCSHLAGA